MSTYLYMKCLDHTPPLLADNESGQHLSDLPQIRADIADRKSLVLVLACDANAFDGFQHYLRSNSLRFLAQHPDCAIGIEDEYGRDHSTEVEK